MAYLRFFRPYYSAYRDENTNQEMDHFMHRFDGSNACDCNSGNIPASNITESEKEFQIEMALPGVDKRQINIKLDKDRLTISLEKPEGENQENYLLREFDFSGTSRTYKLGEKIDAVGISARYENGLLLVHLPKKEAFANKPVQSIVVE